jgi:hypothetical protein
MGNPSEKLVQCTEANSGSVGRRGTPDANEVKVYGSGF